MRRPTATTWPPAPMPTSSRGHAAVVSPPPFRATPPTGTRSSPSSGTSTCAAHDLRHTGLTWFADAGVPVHVLGKIAGHGSLTTTRRYLHPDVRQINAAGAALTAHLSVLRAPRSLPSRIVVAR